MLFHRRRSAIPLQGLAYHYAFDFLLVQILLQIIKQHLCANRGQARGDDLQRIGMSDAATSRPVIDGQYPSHSGANLQL